MNKLFHTNIINPRDFSTTNYRTVDGPSFGGGVGAVMQYLPLIRALESAQETQRTTAGSNAKVIYMSPQGVPITQQLVNELALEVGLVIVCGRYEGIDERFITQHVDYELAVGAFVVSGGELPCQMLIDATVRQLSGAVNNPDSTQAESFMHGLLDYPHFTAPREVGDQAVPVPNILLSGNHANIARWRKQQQLWRTYQHANSLLWNHEFSIVEQQLLIDIIASNSKTKQGV